MLWSREHESREVFLSSSLCVGDRTLHCSFDLWRFVFYELVAPPMYQYFAIVISSTVIGSGLEKIIPRFSSVLDCPWFL